jgi:hypothetical protein
MSGQRYGGFTSSATRAGAQSPNISVNRNEVISWSMALTAPQSRWGSRAPRCFSSHAGRLTLARTACRPQRQFRVDVSKRRGVPSALVDRRASCTISYPEDGKNLRFPFPLGPNCVRPVGYSYWRNMNNHVGSNEVLIFLGLNRSAAAQVLRCSVTTRPRSSEQSWPPLCPAQLSECMGVVLQRHAAYIAIRQRRPENAAL